MSEENVSTSKRTSESCFNTRKIVGHEDLNPNGTLFGGKIMAWIDEVAFMSARRFSGRPFVVTVNVDSISFAMPLYRGEHVVLTSQVESVGRSSMEIGVQVEREDPFSGVRTLATRAHLTFVALDESGRPTNVPRLILESVEEEHRQFESRLRAKVRKRFKAFLERRLKTRVTFPQKGKVPDLRPRYILSRRLSKMGAHELSRAIDRQVHRIEETLRFRAKNL